MMGPTPRWPAVLGVSLMCAWVILGEVAPGHAAALAASIETVVIGVGAVLCVVGVVGFVVVHTRRREVAR